MQSVHFDLTITPVVKKSGMMLSVVKVMPHAIAVTCYARKTNKTKQKLALGFNSAKSERKLIDLLIYSFYSDSTSYRDPRFFGYCLFFNAKLFTSYFNTRSPETCLMADANLSRKGFYFFFS